MNETIYALGFFDGVHIGHAALLSACRGMAAPRGCRAGVVTFGSHPDALVLGQPPRLINTAQDREWLLRERFHMDPVLTLPFDRQMRDMDWRDFLDMLRESHDAVGFVCGADFRFGHRGLGSADSLAQYCREAGLPWAVIPEQTREGIRISSTYIRRQLETGDMKTAVAFLGHPHILRGKVVHGQALPKFGVYACRAWVEGRAYPAVSNIGTRPTVSGHSVSVESWILDYSGDLYDREITLEFYFFLRSEQKFPTLEALQEEIRRNAQQTREFFARLGK